ncbi:MAG: DUF4199 domain-containing protein [Bacteroidales bacterium]
MENSKTAFLKISLKNGLITGGLMIIYSIIIYVFDINMFSFVFGILMFLITFGLLITFMVITMNQYKRKILEGQINYWQCFFAGLVMALVAMWFSGIFNYLFYGLYDTEYMPKQIEKFAEMMQGYGLEGDKLHEQVFNMQEKMQPLKQFISNLYMVPAISIVISLIVSAFIKKNDETAPKDVIR